MKLSYFVFLHQDLPIGARTVPTRNSLIPSFYIKPQHFRQLISMFLNCLISSFYIKPQPHRAIFINSHDCLISSFYIKPQQYLMFHSSLKIVLYRLSTSNHNNTANITTWARLSYIVFLHQTTTIFTCATGATYCLISSFYIKPQPSART